MTLDPTRQLAEFASDLSYQDLPPAVVANAKLSLLDSLGCALFGSTLPWSRILRETLVATEGSGPASVWGTSARLPAPSAALANGAAVHAFELDDLHPRSIVHVGSVTIPAILAAAQTRPEPVNGRRLLTAVVAAYEVGTRVGNSVGAAHLTQGWHPTGTHGTFAATAGAAKVLGLNTDAMQNALGIGGTQAGGLMAAQYGAMVKRFHAGRTAQSGVYAAVLASRGYSGIKNILTADYGGYCRTFSPTFDLAALTEGLGTTWQTLQVGYKPYCANGSCHPTIDMILDLQARMGLAAEDVERVDIAVSTATYHHVGWRYEPVSVTAAQMNLSYVAAVTLIDRAASVDQFAESRIDAPDVMAMAGRVNVVADSAIDALGDAGRHHTRLRVLLRDGRILKAEKAYARGSASDPLSPIEVEQKYQDLARWRLSDVGAATLREIVQHMEEHDSEELCSALQTRPS